ncbi:hypothetical protein ACFQ61_37205 [Streptomyces sp. NPDC056500]|uniref:hypothetical protein n=1 Tax=Streptomyces sp. NPDC056500 TaxID=3345840 RepID=UPI0036B1432F
MDTFLGYLIVLGLLTLLVLPSLVGHVRDRSVDRQLRAAEREDAPLIRAAEPVPPTGSARPDAAPVAVPLRFTPIGTAASDRGPEAGASGDASHPGVIGDAYPADPVPSTCGVGR